MTGNPTSIQTRRRYGRRYAILLFLVLALIAGWIGFWKYAAGEVATILDGWRAREAKSGRVYACGSQSIGGFPFRFELDCDARLGGVSRRRGAAEDRRRPRACWWRRSMSRRC